MGTSFRCKVCCLNHWDHPHACGDKVEKAGFTSTVKGSSPRVWGQGYDATAVSIGKGIIPTRVGTSRLAPTYKVVVLDHPHACGDKTAKQIDDYFTMGSSPRVWGQETATKKPLHNKRIIPTRVGTSVLLRFPLALPQDHPHACGDKCQIIPRFSTSMGSSPRVWGQGYLRI